MIPPIPYAIPNHEYRGEILRSLGTLLNFYTQKHSKAMAVRFDVHYPDTFVGVCHNAYISTCMAYVVKKYKRKGYDPHYMWVIEQNLSMHPHYHCVLLLNAQKVLGFTHVFETVKKAWARTLGMPIPGCINHCLSETDPDYNGKVMRRDAGQKAYQARQQEVFDQISYLAKSYSKLTGQDCIRNFGMSRIPAAVQQPPQPELPPLPAQPPQNVPYITNLFGD